MPQNCDGWQGVGAAEPGGQNAPTSHANACELVEPSGQKYPSAQAPVGVDAPGYAQYAPAGHGSHSSAASRPVASLKDPAGQGCSPPYAVPCGQKNPTGQRSSPSSSAVAASHV